jgi:DNA-binding response OmpR family regulator
MRILLVEDEPEAARLLAKGLREHAYAVDLVEDGATAVFSAQTTNYDAVILDVMLPQLDGLAATRRIRQYPDLKDVPIVAVSAHDTADFHADALAAGCNDYVTKPIDFDQLEALLSRLLPKNSNQ